MSINFFNTDEPLDSSPISIFDYDQDLSVEDYISRIEELFNPKKINSDSEEYVAVALKISDFLMEQTKLSVGLDVGGFIKPILDVELNNRMFNICAHFVNRHLDAIGSFNVSGADSASLKKNVRDILLNVFGVLEELDNETTDAIIAVSESIQCCMSFSTASFFQQMLKKINPHTIDVFLYELLNEHQFVECLQSSEILRLPVETREYLLVEAFNGLLYATESPEQAINLKSEILTLVNHIARDWFIVEEHHLDLKKGVLASYGALLECSDTFNNAEKDPDCQKLFRPVYNQLHGIAHTILGNELSRLITVAESLGVLSNIDYWESVISNNLDHALPVNELGL